MERSRSETLSDAWNLRRVSSIAPAMAVTSRYSLEFGLGIETRNAATPSRSTHGASIQSAGVYDPVTAAHCAKMSGPIADASTVSICAAP